MQTETPIRTNTMPEEINDTFLWRDLYEIRCAEVTIYLELLKHLCVFIQERRLDELDIEFLKTRAEETMVIVRRREIELNEVLKELNELRISEQTNKEQ
jgi:hypothetical protein